MTDVGVRKVPVCFVNFSLHCLIPQRVSEKSYGPCNSKKQTQTVTLNNSDNYPGNEQKNWKRGTIHIVCKICRAKLEEKFPVLQEKNNVAMLRNIFKNVRGPLRSYIGAGKLKCRSAESYTRFRK